MHFGLYVAILVENDFSSMRIDTTYIFFLSIISIICFYLFDLYADWNRRSVSHLFYTTVIATVIASLLFYIITYVFYMPLQKSSFIIALFTQIIVIVGFRTGVLRVMRYFQGEKKVLIIGENSAEKTLFINKFINHHQGWFTISGFLPISNKEMLKEYMDHVEIVFISSTIKDQLQSEIIRLCTSVGKEVMIVPKLTDLSISRSTTQQISDMLVLTIKPPKLTAKALFLKRTFDLFVATIIFVLTSPVLLLLLIIIPLHSKGPAIYKQERLGLNGKPYFIYKFRSMIHGAEKATGPVLATEKDPRITSIGRLIRATRMDELPQIMNVLKGDMSLVGPRPERAFFIQQFMDQLPEYQNRMAVKPGITGLAQVFANYTTTVNDKLAYDLLYIRDYSFMLDIKIMLQTIRVVLQREQAMGVRETKKQRKQQQQQHSTLERSQAINQ